MVVTADEVKVDDEFWYWDLKRDFHIPFKMKIVSVKNWKSKKGYLLISYRVTELLEKFHPIDWCNYERIFNDDNDSLFSALTEKQILNSEFELVVSKSIPSFYESKKLALTSYYQNSSYMTKLKNAESQLNQYKAGLLKIMEMIK